MKLLKIAAALAAVVAPLAAPSPMSQAAKTPFAIHYANIPWFDPVYIADEKGWFAEEGLKIEWAGEVGAAQLVPAVASRSIDIANRMTPLILTANQGGARLKIIFAGAQTTEERPHMKYLVKPDSQISALPDLKGKKIGINSFGACSEYVLKEHLRRNGLDKDVSFVVVPDANQEQALAQGLIDVGVLALALLRERSQGPAADARFSATTSSIMEKLACCLISRKTTSSRSTPDEMKTFVKVLAKTVDWINENHEEAGLIFAKRRGLDPRYAGSWSFYAHGLVPNDGPVQWWIDYLEKEGKLPGGAIKAKDVYTNQYNPFYVN